MRIQILTATAAVLMLSGCGSSDDSKGKATEAGAAAKTGALADTGEKAAVPAASSTTASAAPIKREAGNWKNEIKITKADIPGVPPETINMMKSAMAQASGMEMCLTQEEADKEDIAKKMSDESTSGAKCDYSKKEIAGGNLDVVATCTDQRGRKLDMKMKGTLGAKKVDMNVDVTGAAPNGKGQMNMVMQMTNTHIGECKAGAGKPAN